MATSTAVHSNAFNFMSYLQSGVDPRTGQYTVAISLPSIAVNNITGPDVSLGLNFNPLNTQDAGWGLGWSLPRSEYDPKRSIVSLGSGETFKVTAIDADGLCTMEEQKLLGFKLYDEGGERYRIVHKSGDVEELQVMGSSASRMALPIRLYAISGRSVSFFYEAPTFPLMLTRIEDELGNTLFSVKRNANTNIEVLLQPFAGEQGTPLAKFELTLGANGVVDAVVLPTIERASWRFTYQKDTNTGLMFITQAHSPVGGSESVTYDWTGHQLPAGASPSTLPRVSKHTSVPGFGQATLETEYSYSTKNFLGAGDSAITWDSSGVDNLYQAAPDYVYETLESSLVDGKAVRVTTRTFNCFHLLISELTTQGKNHQEVITEYYVDPDVPFLQQLPYCQLPKNVITRWRLDDEALIRSETVYNEYDNQGNLTLLKQANGLTETSTYYPVTGDGDDCPPDPAGFIRHLKNKTITPVTTALHRAPSLSTTYKYKTLAPFDSVSHAWHVVDTELLQEEVEGVSGILQSTQYHYIDDVADNLRHGRVASDVVTLNGHSLTTSYQYDLGPVPTPGKAPACEYLSTVVVVSSDLDAHTKSVTNETSLFNGQALLTRDDNGVEIRYVYDALQRVVSETVAPGKVSEATRQYSYVLCAQAGDQATQTSINVKGVKTVTYMDGLNRAVGEARINADSKLAADLFRPTYSASYDALGQLVNETVVDWEDDADREMTTYFRYDDWGQQYCTVAPDSVEVYEVTDPRGTSQWAEGVVVTRWQQSSNTTSQVTKTTGKTVTLMNLFEKPVQEQRWDLNNTLVSTHFYEYDGLGRTAKEIDALSNTTLYRYDAFDRMTQTILPGGAVVVRAYAPHSTEDLPVLISIDGTELGTQSFDGLGRMSSSVTGGRSQSYDYAPGQIQPNKVTTAGGQIIEYEYDPLLGEEPAKRTVNGVLATYTYDPKNARLNECTEAGLTLSRSYFSTGQLNSESQGEYTMIYNYSLQGLILGYTDVLGNTQSYVYDFERGGRLSSTKLGTTESSFSYDELGQTCEIATIDTTDAANPQAVTISLQYDEFGREIERSFDLNGVKQKLVQRYNTIDNLVQRVLSALDENGDVIEVLRDEAYEYDARARLTKYSCSGSQKPVDPYGNYIDQQIFRFDALDNITRVRTDFGDESNTAIYAYDGVDPVQLTSVTNNHASVDPLIIVLKYDLNGNLILDERGRILSYDDLNRLTSVSDTAH
ncbi:RHS repeat domain-containing protein [Pseudomonas psychrophila]|uniref:RHS repeat domain-containing protein n=1 Tax=Pseudomonas psychrophila TaxID=122355 RepID=UPI0002D74D07|nr:RHS repeat protein [Pseudomonas psychrophila]